MTMNKRVLSLGKVAYYGRRKENAAELCIETKRGYFSVCGNVWNRKHTDIVSGGQNIEEIASIFLKNEAVQNIKKLWRVFHLQGLDKIPHRFLEVIQDYINGETDNPDFDRLPAARAELRFAERVTDWGKYTEGTLAVYIDGIEAPEVYTLEQGYEQETPILDRAEKILYNLYGSAPKVKTFLVGSNRQDYEQKKRAEEAERLTEATQAAKKVAYILESGEVHAEKVKSALYDLKRALLVLE